MSVCILYTEMEEGDAMLQVGSILEVGEKVQSSEIMILLIVSYLGFSENF